MEFPLNLRILKVILINKRYRHKTPTALIVMAREPRLSRVKTRLQKDLPAKTVLALYKAFVNDVLSVSVNARCDQKFIYWASDTPAIPFLKTFRNDFCLKPQKGADLGMRMYHAFKERADAGFKKIVMIGTDCLSIRKSNIESAFKQLNRHDTVLGPSKDGGYYLIGLNKPCLNYFKQIPWSTGQVLTDTLKRVKQLRHTAFLLPRKDDIDTLTPLKAFYKSPSAQKSIHTWALFKENEKKFNFL